jgi:hypothetical protein
MVELIVNPIVDIVIIPITHCNVKRKVVILLQN